MANLIFQDQVDAAHKLLEILPIKELVDDDYILVCPSLDSTILVDNVARGLGLSYEFLFSETIFAPNNQECAIAMVSESEDIIINDALVHSFDITYDFIYGEAHRKYEEKILKNVYKYRKGNLIGNLNNKNILLVDEGCETGATALLCIKTLRNLGVKSIAYATSVVPLDLIPILNRVVDSVFALNRVQNFIDVDSFYLDKKPLNPEIIMSILEESPYYLPLQKRR